MYGMVDLSEIEVSDNVAVTYTNSSHLLAGQLFDIGVTEVEIVALDAAGNEDTCRFTVSITGM